MLLVGQYKSWEKNKNPQNYKCRISKIEQISKKFKMIQIKKYQRKPHLNPITNLIKSTEKILNVSRKNQLPYLLPKKSNSSIDNCVLEDKDTDFQNKQDQTRKINSAAQSYRKLILQNQNLSLSQRKNQQKHPRLCHNLNQSSLNQISKITCLNLTMQTTEEFSNSKNDNQDKLKKPIPPKYSVKNRSFANRIFKDKRCESEMMKYINQSITYDKQEEPCLKSSKIRINESHKQFKKKTDSSCSQKLIQTDCPENQIQFVKIHDDNISPW